jgi:hypothetical protein
MKRLEDTPIDPEIRAALDAIDATLAGEAVDPRHAELAELSLLVAAERPRPEPAVAAALDERAARRFAKRPSSTPRRPRKRWLWAPAAGLAVAVVIAIAIVASGGTLSSQPERTAGLSSSAGSSAAKLPEASRPPLASPPAAHSSVVPQAAARPQASVGATLQPPPNGRKVVQGAQLALTTGPGRVEAVAQEVFDVIGQAKGVVSSSTVTAGNASGYAQFQLGVPSSSLPQTMAALSTLRYARVASRTDSSQDVNDQFVADVRRLADARALRTALLKQLAGATTQAQIESLRVRINDAEASISSDDATLRQLNRRVDLSQVTLTINAGASPVPGASSGGGFTIGKAARDAGRVLTVAAGVALIGLAALVPIALIAALGWWIATLVRRRRREQALDAI